MTTPREEKYETVLKMVLLGDKAVGKTQIINRYVDDQFHDGYENTIGVDLKLKKLEDEQKVKLQLWDAAGAERFRTIAYSYIRGAQAILICVDLTNRESFENIEKYIEAIDENAKQKPQIFLVGTKADLLNKQEVPEGELQNRAKELGYGCIITSAKTNKNIDQLFQIVAAQTLKAQPVVEKKPVEPQPYVPMRVDEQTTSAASRVGTFLKNHWGKILIGALVVGGVVAIGVFTGGIGIGVAAAVGAVVGGVVIGGGGGALGGALMDRYRSKKKIRHYVYTEMEGVNTLTMQSRLSDTHGGKNPNQVVSEKKSDKSDRKKEPENNAKPVEIKEQEPRKKSQDGSGYNPPRNT